MVDRVINEHSQSATRTVSERPLVVHRETTLADLPAEELSGSEYVLISDSDERIIGIVARREIDRRLYAENPYERNRWRSMPIGAMSKLSIPDDSDGSASLPTSAKEFVPIRDGNSLFGFSARGELYLSWRRLESLFTAALSDPLTGLMNRLAYERRLNEEWNRADRQKNSIGVVVVDLDDFKKVNDTFGHAVGDELLAKVGRKLEVSMRSYDVVARFGGDEFVALCLGCAPGDIRIPITRLLSSLSEILIPVGDEMVSVRASIGAAVRHGDFSDNVPDDLFVAADNCLYEAKRTKNNAWKVEFGAGCCDIPTPVLNDFCACNAGS